MKPPDHKRIDPLHLFTRKSTLPGAGTGMFTRTFIARGQRIIEYKGAITTLKKIQDSKIINPYVYMVNRDHVIDAMLFPDSLGRYANDANGIVTKTGCINNAKFIVVNKKVYFEALADIVAGAEIFVSYGKDYWETIKFNLAVDKAYGPKKKTKKK